MAKIVYSLPASALITQVILAQRVESMSILGFEVIGCSTVLGNVPQHVNHSTQDVEKRKHKRCGDYFEDTSGSWLPV